MKQRKLLIKLLLVIFCIHNSTAQLTGLTITGDPESLSNGATWKYVATVDGISYDLQGILFKPDGAGPFPAIIINHGTGGNATSYSKKIAQEMVTWGYVCIATNYTHSGGVPCGSPGECTCANCPGTNPCTCPDWGASNNNVLRGVKCWDILNSLSYVKEGCILTFGHSRGAWLTTALVGNNPAKFKAAGHTAGGVTTMSGTNAPTSALAANITCPYITHHGENDKAVSLSMDSLLYKVFNNSGIEHELHVYNSFEDDSYCTTPTDQHCLVSMDAVMFERTRAWFDKYGCSAPVTEVSDASENMRVMIYPNPSNSGFYLKTNTTTSSSSKISCYNILGEKLFEKEYVGIPDFLPMEGMNPGIYALQIELENKVIIKEVVIE